MPLALPSVVERCEQRRRRHLLAVDGDRIAALKIDRDVGRLVRRAFGIDGARIDVLRHFVRRVLQHFAFRGGMQQVGIDRERRLAALVLGDRDLMLLGELDQPRARGEIPFAPGGNHGHIGLKRVVGELETHLVVAFTGCAVGDRVGTDLLGNLDLLLGDERTRNRGAEQVLPLIDGIGAKHREDVIAHEFLAQILDKDIFALDAEQQGLRPRRLQLLPLAEIGGEGDHLAAISGLQPLQDDGGVQAARIGKHDFLGSFLERFTGAFVVAGHYRSRQILLVGRAIALSARARGHLLNSSRL